MFAPTDDRQDIANVIGDAQKVRWANGVAMLAYKQVDKSIYEHPLTQTGNIVHVHYPVCAIEGLADTCWLSTHPARWGPLPGAPKVVGPPGTVPTADTSPLCADQKFASERVSPNESCTAFFVGGKTFITAGHCMFDKDNHYDALGNNIADDPNDPKCADLDLVFDFKKDGINAEGVGHNDPRAVGLTRDVYQCDHPVISVQDATTNWDVQVFEVDRDVVGHQPLVVDRSLPQYQPYAANSLRTLGYGLGLPLKIIDGGYTLSNSQNDGIFGNLDIFEGDSGGPVIGTNLTSNALEVVGVNRSGPTPDFTKSGSCFDYRVCPSDGCPAVSKASKIGTDLIGYIPGPSGSPEFFNARIDLDGDGIADQIILDTNSAGFYTIDIKFSGIVRSPLSPCITTPIDSALFPALDSSLFASFFHVADFNGDLSDSKGDGRLDFVAALPGIANEYVDGIKALTKDPLGAASNAFLGAPMLTVSLEDRNNDLLKDLEGLGADGNVHSLMGTRTGSVTKGGLVPLVHIPEDCGTAAHFEGNYAPNFPELASYHAPRAVAVVPKLAVGIAPYLGNVLAVDCPGSSAQSQISFIDPLLDQEVKRVTLSVKGQWRAFTYRPGHDDLLALSDDADPKTPYSVYSVPLSSASSFAPTKILDQPLKNPELNPGVATGVGWSFIGNEISVVVDRDNDLDLVDGYTAGGKFIIEDAIPDSDACPYTNAWHRKPDRTTVGGLTLNGGTEVLACNPDSFGVPNFNRRVTLAQDPLIVNHDDAVKLVDTKPVDEQVPNDPVIPGQWGMAIRDIACDTTTFAPLGIGPTVIWGMSATGRVLRAFPVAPAACQATHLGFCVPPQSGVSYAAAGGDSSFYASTDGTVRAAGDNSLGQLGIGTTDNVSRPAMVDGYYGANSLAASTTHSLAALSDGSVRASGDNSSGELGRDDIGSSSQPVTVLGLPNIVQVAAGTGYSLALDASGQVWSWGEGSRGQLGSGGFGSSSTPARVAGFGELTGNFVTIFGQPGPLEFAAPTAVAAGDAGVFVVEGLSNLIQHYTLDGTLLDQWGGSGTGDGEFTFASGVALVAGRQPFVYVADGYSNRVQKFATDGTFITRFGQSGSGPGQFSSALALDVAPDGDLYVLDSDAGRVQRFRFVDITTPCPPGTTDVAAVGSERTCFVSSFGEMGAGDGQFSAGARGIAVDPTTSDVLVLDTAAARVERFSESGAFIAAWGSPGTNDGQFLVASDVDVAASGRVYVSDASRNDVQIFSMSGSFVGKFGVPGPVAGQLDNPDGVSVTDSERAYVADTGNRRIDVFQIGGSAPVASIAAGSSHALAVTTDGALWGWGANDHGQLGDGTTTDRPAPVRVLDTSGSPVVGVARAAAGRAHSLALTAAGDVLAWGDNEHGQLGDGTTTDRLYAAEVRGVGYATDVAAGDAHSVALVGGGRVLAWGDDSRGQLGNGPQQGASLVPGLVVDPCDSSNELGGMRDVAAGSFHTVANGSVVAWGAGTKGQVGDGANVDRQVPTPIRFTAAPDCSAATASPSTLFPPPHGLIPISIQGVTTAGGDAATIQISSVTQDEPVTGPGQGDFQPDAVISSDGSSVSLRAERSGTGDGRVYHVKFTASDGGGSECHGEVDVCVPHDRNGKCVDGGGAFDSTTTTRGGLCDATPSASHCQTCMQTACCDQLVACDDSTRCGGRDGELGCIDQCLLANPPGERPLDDALAACADECAKGPHLARDTVRLLDCIAGSGSGTSQSCAVTCWGEQLLDPGALAKHL